MKFVSKSIKFLLKYSIGLILPWWLMNLLYSLVGANKEQSDGKKIKIYTIGLIFPWWAFSGSSSYEESNTTSSNGYKKIICTARYAANYISGSNKGTCDCDVEGEFPLSFKNLSDNEKKSKMLNKVRTQMQDRYSGSVLSNIHLQGGLSFYET